MSNDGNIIPGRWDCTYCPEHFDTRLEWASHEGRHERHGDSKKTIVVETK